jgi:hypothetical protein
MHGNKVKTIATDKTCKLFIGVYFVSEGQTTQQPTVTVVPPVVV